MPKKHLTLAIVILLYGLPFGKASAIDVNVIPDQTILGIGDTLTIDVQIGGLGFNSPPSLGVFDIDLNYDPGLFSPFAVMFGGELSLFGPGIQDVIPSPAALNVFELSFDTPDELDNLQSGSFLLFSVQFDVLTTGVGVFDLALNGLGDAFGAPLQAVSDFATVQVQSPNAVPVPAAVWLFGTALAGFIGFGRRRQTAR